MQTINEEFYSAPTVEKVSTAEPKLEKPVTSNVKYLFAGILFGIVGVKGEIVSWYRIQEMFRLHSFYMYGVIGTAVAIGVMSVLLIQKLKLRTFSGEEIIFHKKIFHWGNVFGGVLFGLGWALTGACPGPMFAQIGSGFLVVSVTLLSAIAGTWVYGLLREKLPH